MKESATSKEIEIRRAYNDTLAYNKYRKIAGEIEAWDVHGRLDITAEQRKNTRPDIDRTDVVFAYGNGDNYDIGVLDNGNTYVKASRNVITATDVKGMRSQITDFFNVLLEKNGSMDITALDGTVLTITKKETANKARDNYKEVKGQRIKLSDDEFFIKMKVESHIDEIVKTSFSNNKISVPDTKNHLFAKSGFAYRTTYFEDFNGDYYKITFSVGNDNNVGIVYNVGKIKKDKLPSAKLIAVVRSKPLGKMSSTVSISNPAEKVNINLKESAMSKEIEIRRAYNDTLAYNKYRKIAGEIEAWDVEERLDITAEQRKNTRPDIDRTDVVFADGGVSYSIVENFIDEKGNKYENAVLLDTDFFDGVSPRNWGRKLQIYVENRSINNSVIMPIFDESGNKQVLAFAKINDRVRNNRVINELYRTSDNISKISVIHIDEIAEVSKENNPYYSKTNSHEWLDKNGWLHRNANVINKKMVQYII